MSVWGKDRSSWLSLLEIEKDTKPLYWVETATPNEGRIGSFNKPWGMLIARRNWWMLALGIIREMDWDERVKTKIMIGDWSTLTSSIKSLAAFESTNSSSLILEFQRRAQRLPNPLNIEFKIVPNRRPFMMSPAKPIVQGDGHCQSAPCLSSQSRRGSWLSTCVEADSKEYQCLSASATSAVGVIKQEFVIDSRDRPELHSKGRTSSVTSDFHPMSPNSGPVKLEEGAIKSEPSSAPCIAQGESEDWGSRVDGARGSVAKLQPSTVIEPERYREETLSLAGCLARYIAEGDDVAFQIGCLLLQVIERIKYLVSVQASQKAVDMAINRVLGPCVQSWNHR
ncbi:hypothetical protein BKA70DRAFT_1228817 [Coprinopsis sp. MPI-PUGE-AT-0042]|nr:hypothetical protein BKA70DRAFT_1228817 [Coprinopsis sp. MPI-PUGE-AT-0042]